MYGKAVTLDGNLSRLVLDAIIKHQTNIRAVVEAQLVEQSHLTPETCGSNPNIGKILFTNCTIEKKKRKEKEAGHGPSLKKRQKHKIQFLKNTLCLRNVFPF